MNLDSKIPEGPLSEKWTNYKASQKLVNPANKRKIDIIVVGTGLAGASAAASLGALGFNVDIFCIQDSPRRAHSIAAQGGINGKNLKSIPVVYPDSIPEQRLIVEELDILTNIIDRKDAQMRDLDALSDSLFYEMFGDPSINDRHWETQSLRNLCDKLYAGGDVPKDRLSKEKTSTFSVPILSNGKGDSALYGYTDIPRETSEAITISGRGTIGYSSIQTEPFFPVVRLIVAVPKPSVEISFLQKQLSLMEFESTGGAIPQLTIPMVRDRRLINPPIEIQREYAEKRKLIEQQKSIIFDSLSAVKSLLKNRMDHCFN